jgi:hypothetical protein
MMLALANELARLPPRCQEAVIRYSQGCSIRFVRREEGDRVGRCRYPATRRLRGMTNEAITIERFCDCIGDRARLAQVPDAAALEFGHGAATVLERFRELASEGEGASSAVTDQPHNQTFQIAIQLGFCWRGPARWGMDIASTLVPRRGIGGLARGRPEYSVVHIQCLPVGIHVRLDIRVWRWRARRHDALPACDRSLTR